MRLRRVTAHDIETFCIALYEARRVARLRLFEAGNERLDANSIAKAEFYAQKLESLAAPVVALAEARAVDDLDDYLNWEASEAAHAFEAEAADWLGAEAARLDEGLRSPPRWTASPDAWLKAAEFFGAPMSAVVAASRRLALYREIARRAAGDGGLCLKGASILCGGAGAGARRCCASSRRLRLPSALLHAQPTRCRSRRATQEPLT